MMYVRALRNAWRFEIEASGHAEAGPFGSDIVCAAASMLCATLRQCAQDEHAAGRVVLDEVQEVSGRFRIVVKDGGGPSRFRHQADAICTGLKMLAEAYPRNVRFEDAG